MRTLLYILFALSIVIITSCVKEKEISPAQADNFLKMFGSYKTNEGYDLKQTADGGFIIIGKTILSGQNEDIILIKTDKFGNLEWEKTFDIAGGNDSGNSLQIDSDGGYIILGTCTKEIGDTDMYLLKTNTEGDSLWSRKIDFYNLNQVGKSISPTIDGGYILVGNTEVSGVDGIQTDIYCVKLDASRNIIWEDTDGSMTMDDNASCVIENYDDKYMMIGSTKLLPLNINDNSKNIYVTIYSPINGIIVNSCTYGRNLEDEGAGLVKVDGSNYIMAGTITENSKKKIYVRKFGGDQSSGLQDSLWANSYNTGGDVYASAISATSDNGVVVIGKTISGTNADTYLIKIDESGNESFSQTFGGSRRDEGNAVIETSDNGFAIIGTTEFDNRAMICLIKTNSAGNL